MRLIRGTITRTAMAATALATGAMLTMGGTASAAQAAGTIHGCPSGYVCLYPGAGWNGDKPSHKFYKYGTHKIYDQYGKKRWFNNQTGGAKAYRCKGSNGTNCGGNQRAGTYYDHDFTPINSVKLAK
ncbi:MULTISPECIES: hypothetical protein [unclassified Streptomyces]|uniref:hypothetical protein n=1 Tax=unclassified Streptomyces TaxID=2593676 RepID=UPI0015877164|nr:MULTISPECIES: hypothetical protein [unclassified Streptomyces]NUV67258.1 hypothetical protein [Streptomyces sp. CAI-121]NUW04237.1 hypothetical protein [Streptomyces sp. CAI 127]NUW13376.1 hypothetical protein [Streptomyces sp. CAI-68]